MTDPNAKHKFFSTLRVPTTCFVCSRKADDPVHDVDIPIEDATVTRLPKLSVHGLNQKTQVTWCGVRCVRDHAIAFEASPHTDPQIDLGPDPVAGAKALGITCEDCLSIAETVKYVEKVEHPAHYGGDTTYETIKVLEAWLTPEEFRGFLKGNAIKYLSRAGKKSRESAQDDQRKAKWYLDRLQEKK